MLWSLLYWRHIYNENIQANRKTSNDAQQRSGVSHGFVEAKTTYLTALLQDAWTLLRVASPVAVINLVGDYYLIIAKGLGVVGVGSTFLQLYTTTLLLIIKHLNHIQQLAMHSVQRRHYAVLVRLTMSQCTIWL